MSGISILQGSHHVAQKFKKTTWPRYSESRTSRPSSVVSTTSGARWPTRGASVRAGTANASGPPVASLSGTPSQETRVNRAPSRTTGKEVCRRAGHKLVGLDRLALLLQQLNNGLNALGLRPVTWPDNLLPEHAALINDVRLRHAHQLIPLVGLAPGIREDRERQFQILDERRDVFRRRDPVHADGQHDEVLLLEVFPEHLHRGHLFLAGLAPGGPEVQEDDLAAIVRQLLLFPLEIRQAEVRRGHANDERLVFRALKPDDAECHRENGQPSEEHDQPTAQRHRPADRTRHGCRAHFHSALRSGLWVTHRHGAPRAGS